MIEAGAKENPVLTAMLGKNADLFVEIARLYIPANAVVADVTYANGNFWSKVDTAQYNCRFTDLSTGVDMCDLPYEDASIDVVVIDPPYMYNPKGTVKASLSSPYNLNAERLLKTNADVLSLYYDAIDEGLRVLSEEGRLIIKCQDIIQSGIQRWNHIYIHDFAVNRGMYAKDLFVLQTQSKPAMRWDHQHHARKNHSYFWIFDRNR